MKNKTVISVAMALCLAISGSAFAQGNSHHDERGQNEQARHGGNERGNGVSHDRGNNQARANDGWRHEGRGAGPRHDLHKGKFLPREYRSNHYVVNDWRGHRLSAPPRGYHWVQAGGDYVLVRISNGLIFQINLN